jgi:hypothetical protein
MSRTLYKSALFMQNKPNFRKAKMNENVFATKDYDNESDFTLQQNKPSQTQFQPRPNTRLGRNTPFTLEGNFSRRCRQ